MYRIGYSKNNYIVGFWSLVHVASEYLVFFSLGYETMSKSAKIAGLMVILLRCFKQLFSHIGVYIWTFARFVRPLALSHQYFVYGKFGLVPITTDTCHVFHWLAKKKITKTKACHRTEFEADLWPETGDFYLALGQHVVGLKLFDGINLPNNVF